MENDTEEGYENLRNDLRDTIPQAVWRKLKKIGDCSCLKTAVYVGTGIHLYSQTMNNQHIQNIYQDVIEGDYLKGGLKTLVPYVLPYTVSFYSRKKAQREANKKIGELENKLKSIE